jgi:hypothetical protein
MASWPIILPFSFLRVWHVSLFDHQQVTKGYLALQCMLNWSFLLSGKYCVSVFGYWLVLPPALFLLMLDVNKKNNWREYFLVHKSVNLWIFSTLKCRYPDRFWHPFSGAFRYQGCSGCFEFGPLLLQENAHDPCWPHREVAELQQ